VALEQLEASRLLSQETTSEESETETEAEALGETAEERTAEAPIVGTEATANLGPLEGTAGAGLMSSNSNPAETNPSPARARKRWI
jgi:hypothetical protein